MLLGCCIEGIAKGLSDASGGEELHEFVSSYTTGDDSRAAFLPGIWPTETAIGLRMMGFRHSRMNRGLTQKGRQRNDKSSGGSVPLSTRSAVRTQSARSNFGFQLGGTERMLGG